MNLNLDFVEGRYYTYHETAQILRCSEKTIYNRVKAGEIIPIQNGRLRLFSYESIKEFVENSMTPKPLRNIQHNPEVN